MIAKMENIVFFRKKQREKKGLGRVKSARHPRIFNTKHGRCTKKLKVKMWSYLQISKKGKHFQLVISLLKVKA